MASRVIYLVRHGEIRRDDDLPRYVGQLDVPLSEAGRRQAGELARRFRATGLGTITCSDLSRSLETARIVGEAVGLEVAPRRDLREVSLGAWEGYALREIEQRFPEQYRARGEDFAGFHPPGGESFSECSERVVRAFHEIVRTTQGDVLMVGHAGVNRLLLCHVLGMLPANLFRLGQDYGCCNVIRCEGSRYQVSVLNGGPPDLRRERARAASGRHRRRASEASS
ncbi:MAG TPA: histidine phosphatase family protein [Anaeromyxobacter sp.]|nr:histidine phosphatase family protein [Anaeromyxobacter sp.]